MTKESKLLKSALSYAERGWPVLPLHWPNHESCSCENPKCRSVGKHPLTRHGVKDACTEEETIREWWKKWPKANVGIATGPESDVFVLDKDVIHGGEESLRALEAKLGPLPVGPRVRTGGGGSHYYFCQPEVSAKNKVGIAPGVDVRAGGGFVVAPPSLHKSGRKYRWPNEPPEGSPLPELPKKWLNFLASARSPNHHIHKNVVGERQTKSAIASSARELFRKGRNSGPTVPSKAVVRVLQRLENVVELCSGWTARCPAHDDNVNSLSVNEGADGQALIFCHAGCEFEQVVTALGLRVRDMFVQRKDLPWR